MRTSHGVLETNEAANDFDAVEFHEAYHATETKDELQSHDEPQTHVEPQTDYLSQTMLTGSAIDPADHI